MIERNLKETLQACQDFGFNREITAEMCWNEAYKIGRRRWYWGPMWVSSVRGWINTQWQKLRKPKPLSAE